MNCQQFRSRIASQARGGDADMLAHLSACELCQHWQFNMLLQQEFDQETPVPRAGLVDELIGNATARGERRRMQRFSLAASVAAATLALGVLAGNWFSGYGNSDNSRRVALAPRVAEMIDVIIDSAASRDDATLTIELGDNLELDGFPNERVISWQTDLTQGKNLLRLPVILMDENDGRFNVGLSYGHTRKAITVEVRAQLPEQDPGGLRT